MPAAAALGPMLHHSGRPTPTAAPPRDPDVPTGRPDEGARLRPGTPGGSWLGRAEELRELRFSRRSSSAITLVLAGHPLGEPLHLLGQAPVLGGELDEYVFHHLAASL